tara:strand:+ start:720 stop:923 length:204 start_codon:yes stop_codon:yes gene_type:complete
MHPVNVATLLKEVLHVIDTTNPEAAAHLDSGADSMQLLIELEEEIRDTIFELSGVYPVVKEPEYEIR